jgi:hypothetical protein
MLLPLSVDVPGMFVSGMFVFGVAVRSWMACRDGSRTRASRRPTAKITAPAVKPTVYAWMLAAAGERDAPGWAAR